MRVGCIWPALLFYAVCALINVFRHFSLSLSLSLRQVMNEHRQYINPSNVMFEITPADVMKTSR
jgi:hypothetical protein